MLFDLYRLYEPVGNRINIYFSDAGPGGGIGGGDPDAGGLGGPGDMGGGNPSGDTGSDGPESQYVQQDIFNEKGYKKWKEKYKGVYTLEGTGNEFSQKDLNSFKEKRYKEWRDGAWDSDFSQDEITEFQQRDTREGISDKRKEMQLEKATAEKPYVKYDPDTGRPIGLYYKDYYTGEEKLIKSYDKMNELLDQIEATQFPTFNEWLTSTGNTKNDLTASNAYQQMQTIANELASGNFSQDVLDEAMKYTAQILGVADYGATVGGMQNQLAQGISGQQGLSDQEQANLRTASREAIRKQEIATDRALEAVRANGESTAKYLRMADEYASQITSQKVQSEIDIAKESFDRKTAEWNALDQQYQYLVSTGMASRTDYLNAYQENRASALQAYATQINVLVQENQELFQQYNTDQQALAANLQNMYAAINAEMGFDSWALNDMEQTYSDTVLPILQELDYITQQQYLEIANEAQQAQEAANQMQFVGDIIGGISRIFGG